MPDYTWRNKRDGRVVEITRTIPMHKDPPNASDGHPGFYMDWVRVLTPVGIGQVQGAGGSPPRAAAKRNK